MIWILEELLIATLDNQIANRAEAEASIRNKY